MLIGMDVGGTCTDAVLLDDKGVRATAKVPTRTDLLASLTEALDRVTSGVSTGQIRRVTLSTTLITNLIAEKKYAPVGLITMPGPGMNPGQFQFPSHATHFVNGAIDYRGREIVPLDQEAILNAIKDFEAGGISKVAIVGKFSTRNNSHEQAASSLIKSAHPEWQVEMGHLVASQLNFPRRVMTTYLTAATREHYRYFADAAVATLRARHIDCPVFILKADGGTCPLSYSLEMPMETLFSGPAASTLGVQALTPPGETVVVVDIGGTTTDLALILSGQPLLSTKGAKIDQQLTQVRALSVHFVPIGGDSVVDSIGNDIVIYTERVGSPYCLGGPLPTPTDALRVLGLTMLGNEEQASQAMAKIGAPLGLSAVEAARRVMTLLVERVAGEIKRMFLEWHKEPAYNVWEILQKQRGGVLKPQTVVGVGGGAAGFVTQIAAAIGCYPIIPPYAPVANAIGAAVAKPTMQVTLRADTEAGYYSILEEGLQEKIPDKCTEDELVNTATGWLVKRSAKYGLKVDDEPEIVRREVFNMVRDWRTTGRLYDIALQTPRGILAYIGAGGAPDER